MTRNPIVGPVLVTGASGFVGSALLKRMLADGLTPRAAFRGTARDVPGGLAVVERVNLDADYDWRPALAQCSAVVHTAARVHLMRDTAPDPLPEFRRVNVEGTQRIARQAADVGVGRFVFLSSIKVNGERTQPGRPFRAEDPPAPTDAYGISKHEAEQALLEVGADTGMEVVIVRPVLVYGPGVKANFLSMMRWLARGIPLPLGALHNRRSLVGLDNLVDLLTTCLHHTAAVNETFLVSDEHDLSTTELLRRMAAALGRPPRLIPVPERVLKAGASLLGKGDLAQRLLGSLQVEIGKPRNLLGWSPPMSIDDELRVTAQWFLNRERAIA
jgi:nucleoside-diphosphate-sugar epimerase